MHLFKGTLGRKEVMVFSTASEARDYCQTHGGYDHKWEYKPTAVYTAY